MEYTSTWRRSAVAPIALSICAAWLCACSLGQSVSDDSSIKAQAVPAAHSTTPSRDYQFTCPGSFASDLTVVNCEYTSRARLQQFIATGVTDQAMLLSVSGSLFTQAVKSPSEWPRTWEYYGRRVGTSYVQSVGNATAQYLVGSVIKDDPRHVQCNRDPLLYGENFSGDKPYSCTNMQRFGHALLDSITVRKSNPGMLTPLFMESIGYFGNDPKRREDYIARYKSNYRRWPAFSRLVGAFAGAYAQYPWEPGSNNKFSAISERAALAFAPTFLGSFYTEYGSSIFSFFKKGKQ